MLITFRSNGLCILWLCNISGDCAGIPSCQADPSAWPLISLNSIFPDNHIHLPPTSIDILKHSLSERLYVPGPVLVRLWKAAARDISISPHFWPLRAALDTKYSLSGLDLTTNLSSCQSEMSFGQDRTYFPIIDQDYKITTKPGESPLCSICRQMLEILAKDNKQSVNNFLLKKISVLTDIPIEERAEDGCYLCLLCLWQMDHPAEALPSRNDSTLVVWKAEWGRSATVTYSRSPCENFEIGVYANDEFETEEHEDELKDREFMVHCTSVVDMPVTGKWLLCFHSLFRLQENRIFKILL